MFTLGFDADDTLWHCERDFQAIQQRFVEMLEPFMDSAEAAGHLEIVERGNLAIFGFGVKGFTLSMVESAIMLSDGAVSADDIHAIVGWGKELLGSGARGLQLLDTVDEAIALARAYSDEHGLPLVLITKGDLFEQETKVAASGLGDRFDIVEVVADKTPEHYRRVLSRHGIDPRALAFVGNSVRSDILPVLEIGGQAFHVPYPLVWAHEEAELPVDEPHLHHAADLLSAVRAMVELSEAAVEARG